jgi:LPPG:FO 2-phospho-L-lactate transferase
VTSAHYTVLAGGTGAAKFLRGLVQVVPEEEIHVIVNIGDDTDIWGLHVSPDIDSVTYGLSGKLDTKRGWGLADETFRCLEEIRAYGMPMWFQLGDRDLATHITRTELLHSGRTLTEVTQQMAQAMGIRATILPASDHPVRTKIETPGGILGFQEFFVREHWKPEVRSVIYAGATEARASEAVLDSIRHCQLVIIAPSNPITSIGPMLAIHDIRDALRCTRAEVVAISPLIGNEAFSGPAAKLMEACGFDVSPSGVARCYHDFLDELVIDLRDSALAPSIRYNTIGVQITDILMSDDAAATRLARFVINENSPVAG